MPYTAEALRHMVSRVRKVQDFLGERIAVENPSTYVELASSTIPEWDFLAELAEAADCALLLDVNNVYVSAHNHGFDPYAYLKRIPLDRVLQFHVAGHTHCGTHIVDTHRGPVIEAVWQLVGWCHQRAPASVLLEWDEDVPALDRVHEEALLAKGYLDYVEGREP